MGKIIYLALLFCPLGVVLTCNRDSHDWEAWKQKYGKRYGSFDEEEDRRKIWSIHREMVHTHNHKGDHTFMLELNHLADQFQGSYNKLKLSRSQYKIKSSNRVRNLTPVPSQFDWRTKGAVTPVHNQGEMGKAQVYAATECVESYNFIKTGKLVELSIQETSDCCGSHLYGDVFNCIHDIGGLCSAADYPSHAGPGCHNASCSPVIQINGGKMVPSGNENALLETVLKVPVMAVIDASRSSFQLYRSGIYDDPGCSEKELDHAVQIVGYGTQGAGKDYWIVRNSWGAEWGMRGYILMSRNKHNQCGIATSAYYPY